MKLPWRIGIQQRVLPTYRTQLFDLIGRQCPAGLQVFAGAQNSGEGIAESAHLTDARLVAAENRYVRLGGSHLLVQKNIRTWLEDWQPECLVVEANPRNISTPSAMRWAKRHGAQVIGWGLGVPAGRALPGIRSAYWKAFLSRFDGLITYSTHGKNSYSRVGFPAPKIFVAPNAVAVRPVRQLRRRPDHLSGKPNLLMVGRLIENKKADKLLLACAGLPAPLRPRVTVIGEGPARAEWIQLAAQVYPEAVFPGDVRGAELEAYFEKADIFVLPGTGGLAVQQAMSFALPVIVGAADGTQSDLVRPGNGWQLEDDRIETLSRVLAQALANVARLRQMGEESRRIVQEEVNLENMVEAFTAAIHETMSAK